MAVKAVFFDVGETLVSEARQWREWAAWLDVPLDRFLSLQRAAIERREHHRQVFERLRPGFDLALERAKRVKAGKPDGYDSSDLYPDATPCLKTLRALGLIIGVAGNQPMASEHTLREMGLAVDIVGSSASWGAEKPAPLFFSRLTNSASLTAHEIAYVGDRLDNDVLPARQAGMVAVFLKRGPWAESHARWPEAAEADITIESLAALPESLRPYL